MIISRDDDDSCCLVCWVGSVVPVENTLVAMAAAQSSHDAM